MALIDNENPATGERANRPRLREAEGNLLVRAEGIPRIAEGFCAPVREFILRIAEGIWVGTTEGVLHRRLPMRYQQYI
jgi:hypothetical protein